MGLISNIISCTSQLFKTLEYNALPELLACLTTLTANGLANNYLLVQLAAHMRRGRNSSSSPCRFHVLLTTYEHLMGKNDRPRLARIDWQWIVVDEGHRLKVSQTEVEGVLPLRAERRGGAWTLVGTSWDPLPLW